MKPTREQLEELVTRIKYVTGNYYWCKWCKRHLPVEDGTVMHDNVFHPANYTPECGGEHVLH